MNLSNKLTIFRIILVPFFLFFFLCEKFLLSLVLFLLAILTDFLDGKIARLKNEVTDFGRFLDPIADKILTTSAYLYFAKLNFFSIVPIFLILSREFVVSAVRLLACSNGQVVAANFWGKLKTFFQTLSIIFAILFLYFSINLKFKSNFLNFFVLFSNIFVWLSAIISVISGFSYAREYLNFKIED